MSSEMDIKASNCDLAFRIRDLRRIRGLTLKEVAAAVGVSSAAVCNWESGRSIPKLERLKTLAGALDTNVTFLLGAEWVGTVELGTTEAQRMLAAQVIRRARADIASALDVPVSAIKIDVESPR